jgi:hypothetical protein
MFSQKELREIDRRKQVVVARSDLLREECEAIWGALGRRVTPAVSGLRFLRHIPPTAFSIALGGLAVVKQRYASRSRLVGPALSVAGFALNAVRPAEKRAIEGRKKAKRETG